MNLPGQRVGILCSLREADRVFQASDHVVPQNPRARRKVRRR